MAVFPVDCGNGALILLKLRTTGELQYTALHEGVAPTTLVCFFSTFVFSAAFPSLEARDEYVRHRNLSESFITRPAGMNARPSD